MQTDQIKVLSLDNVPVDRRRGGMVQTLLSPKTVGSTSGFMGVATIAPGQQINEHYHPYSEEFIYVTHGTIIAQLNDIAHTVQARQGLVVPIGIRHRLKNTSDQEASIVFHLGPLAPRPDLGHVDTETT